MAIAHADRETEASILSISNSLILIYKAFRSLAAT